MSLFTSNNIECWTPELSPFKHFISSSIYFSSRILKPRDHLFITKLINRPGISDTISRRKKKERRDWGLHFTGLDLDTRNHYQRVGGRDQHGPYTPRIDEPRSSLFQNLINIHFFIRKFSHSYFFSKHINRSINFKF